MKKENLQLISIIIPCHNEQDNIELLYNSILKTFPNKYHPEFLFIDDGSTDKTLNEIKKLAEKFDFIKYISFSKNFGHQNALSAGFDFAEGDCIVSIDADMQHPPELIPQMIEKWEEGFQIVNSIRIDKNIGFFKNVTSRLFYKIINFLSDTKIEPGAADFRLLDKKVVEVIKNLTENHLFIRGLTSWIGFKQERIEYIARERKHGKSSYSLKRMVHFAAVGITSFSTKPLKLSIYLGVIMAFCAFLYSIYAIYASIFTDKTITGWTSLILAVLFIGAIQLIILGIIGQYLGKLFIENKRRPKYIIDESKIK
ncbi:glycosyltransferase family 2 protein [Bacteroidota bacterium]